MLAPHGDTAFGAIRIARTAGQHGSDAVMAALGARMGSVCGVVLRHPDEPTLYIAGDTVFNAHVAAALEAVNHCMLSRAELRAFAQAHGVAGRVRVPEDGEVLAFAR